MQMRRSVTAQVASWVTSSQIIDDTLWQSTASTVYVSYFKEAYEPLSLLPRLRPRRDLHPGHCQRGSCALRVPYSASSRESFISSTRREVLLIQLFNNLMIELLRTAFCVPEERSILMSTSGHVTARAQYLLN